MEEKPFQKILVPTDFSHYSERGICAAVEMARHFDSELYFINVWPPEFMFEEELRSHTDEELRHKLEQIKTRREDKLKAFANRFSIDGLRSHFMLKSGPPYLEIIIAARELEVSLIVIGTHGFTGLKGALIGSVAEKVVRRSTCPVMTVKPGGFECDSLTQPVDS